MKTVKKVIGGVVFGFVGAVLVSCAYGGAAGVSGDNVVVLKNDMFLWGLLRTAYVCKATPNGLTNCCDSVSP